MNVTTCWPCQVIRVLFIYEFHYLTLFLAHAGCSVHVRWNEIDGVCPFSPRLSGDNTLLKGKTLMHGKNFKHVAHQSGGDRWCSDGLSTFLKPHHEARCPSWLCMEWILACISWSTWNINWACILGASVLAPDILGHSVNTEALNRQVFWSLQSMALSFDTKVISLI